MSDSSYFCYICGHPQDYHEQFDGCQYAYPGGGVCSCGEFEIIECLWCGNWLHKVEDGYVHYNKIFCNEECHYKYWEHMGEQFA